MTAIVPATCERARTWASLRADGELSELEAALLDAHLGRCDDCSAFARGSLSIAAAIRSARLEPPRLRLALPRRRRRARRGLQVLLLAAVAAVAVSAGLSSSGHPAGAGTGLPRPVAMLASTDSPDGLRELRRASLRNRNVLRESV